MSSSNKNNHQTFAKFEDAYMEIIQDQRIYQGSLYDRVSIVLRKCTEVLDVDGAGLWLMSDNLDKLSCLCFYNAIKAEFITAEQTTTFDDGSVALKDARPILFDNLLNCRIIDASDALTDPRVSEIVSSTLQPQGIQSLLMGTIRDLRYNGSTQGAVSIEMKRRQREWTIEEKMFLTSITDLLSQRLITSKLDNSEANYRTIFETSEEAIFIAKGARVVSVNPRACALFGCSQQEMIGAKTTDFMPEYQPNGETSYKSGVRHFKACIAGGASYQFEWRYKKLDGSEFDAEVTMTPIKSFGEDARITLIRDITTRKANKELSIENIRLELAKSEAEKLAQSKMDFLANMSHEIRTPMNGIFGMVSLVLDTELDSQQKDYIEAIQSSTESLLTTLNDVLEYSKLSNSEVVLELREFDIRQLVLNVMRTFEGVALKKELKLESFIAPNTPKTLLGDDHRLRQILSNLVANAIKFTKQGSVDVRVNSKLSDNSKHSIRFSVLDTGIGIDQLTISKLFKPFTQADASITRNYGGTGLGLAICRDLANAMDGAVSIDSELGSGSAFHFDVCLEDVNQVSSELMPIGAQNSAPTISQVANDLNFHKTPILVVEDNLINQKVTSSILEKLGYPVTIASNGKEAVELCSKNNYNIILMDLSMPQMDGFEATERIRRNEKEGKQATIIAVTGHAFQEHREHCEEVGIDDFLAKPYNLFKLKEKLDFYSG